MEDRLLLRWTDTLPAACATAGKSVDEFIDELTRAAAVPDGTKRDWPAETLTSMAANIVSMYHAYTREELATLAPIADKVLSVHGQRRPELAEVVAIVGDLTTDLLPHMLKEEQVLFPYVSQMEEAAAGRRQTPTPFFGTVKNPVRMMILEHDRVGELLARARVLTGEYPPPESACFSYRELYRRLAELELRTHEHIHVENTPMVMKLQIADDLTTGARVFGDTCHLSSLHRL